MVLPRSVQTPLQPLRGGTAAAFPGKGATMKSLLRGEEKERLARLAAKAATGYQAPEPRAAGIVHQPRGVGGRPSALSDAEVRAISADERTHREIAAAYAIQPWYVWAIKRGFRKSWVR